MNYILSDEIYDWQLEEKLKMISAIELEIVFIVPIKDEEMVGTSHFKYRILFKKLSDKK